MKNKISKTSAMLMLLCMIAILITGCTSENAYILEKEYAFFQEEDGQYQLSQTQGKEIYDFNIRYFDNRIIVGTQIGYILFDENENPISPPYQGINPLYNDLLDQETWENDYYFKFMLDEKWGLMDKNGKVIFENQFDEIEGYSEGILSFVENGNTGLMNLQGEVIVPPRPGYFSRFRNGVAFFYDGDDYYGAINQKGEVLIAPKYEALVILENGYVMAYTADIDPERKQFYDDAQATYTFGSTTSGFYNMIFKNKFGTLGNWENNNSFQRTGYGYTNFRCVQSKI